MSKQSKQSKLNDIFDVVEMKRSDVVRLVCRSNPNEWYTLEEAFARRRVLYETYKRHEIQVHARGYASIKSPDISMRLVASMAGLTASIM